MNRTATVEFGENQLAALNARADALSLLDAEDWDEAVDWGVPDYSDLTAVDRRMLDAPDLE